MRKAMLLLLLGLTLVAARSAVAQVSPGTPMTVSAKQTQTRDGTITASGAVLIRIGEYEIRAEQAEITRVR